MKPLDQAMVRALLLLDAVVFIPLSVVMALRHKPDVALGMFASAALCLLAWWVMEANRKKG